jgi:starvation-inducible DNA-binding protein
MKLSDALFSVLSNQYALSLKTQNYHWNVEGANFMSLHDLFEDHYKELIGMIDATAEHIRSLGLKVPSSLELFSKESRILPATETYTADEMLDDLIQSHQVMEAVLIDANNVSENSNDLVISDYLTECLTFHRKAIWMLRSSK